MSYDLCLASRLKPTERHVRSLWADDTGILVSETFGSHSNLVAETADGDFLATIDAPARAEAEEMEALPRGISPRPRWVTFLSTPAAGGARGLAFARTTALSLAASCDGVVYDPQRDELLGSDGSPVATRRPDPPEQRVSVINVEWFMPLSRFSAATGEAFLAVANTLLPQVTPRKRSDFVAWLSVDVSRDRHPDDTFFWNGRKPCPHGLARVRQRPDWPHPAVPAWKLSLDILEEPVSSSSRLRDAVIQLFTKAATTLGAFYAAAYVERELILHGRSLGYDFRTFQAQRVMIPLWCGLPRPPMWLAWFGPPYAELVSEAIAPAAIRIGNGLLLQASELPGDAEQLCACVPELPLHLTQNSRRHTRVVTHADGSRGELFEPIFESAEWIPQLDL